jgi:LAGLIDADG endonuclease
MTNYTYEKNLCLNLNPDFITGLTESEGSFSVSIHKDKIAKFKINVGLRYKIRMLSNELTLLKMVESFFSCGILFDNKDGSVDFTIRDISSIRDRVLPHFLNHPLRGTKYLDFLSFKEAFTIINSKEHLLKEGLFKLYTK